MITFIPSSLQSVCNTGLRLTSQIFSSEDFLPNALDGKAPYSFYGDSNLQISVQNKDCKEANCGWTITDYSSGEIKAKCIEGCPSGIYWDNSNASN